MIFNVVVDVIFSGGTTELNGSLFGLIALLFLISFFLVVISIQIGLKVSDAFDEKGFLNPSNKKRSTNFLFVVFLMVTAFCLFLFKVRILEKNLMLLIKKLVCYQMTNKSRLNCFQFGKIAQIIKVKRF